MSGIGRISARSRALNSIRVGDVIYGIASGGQQKILLVYEADPVRILARHITSQAVVEFGRDGKSRRVPNGGSCTITSTTSLPPEDYDIAVGLDRKMRNAREHPDFMLSKREMQLILTAHSFFEAHPLPET